MAKKKKHPTNTPLHKAIKSSGLSNYQIAKDTSIDFMVVSRFVSGERGITYETALRLQYYLDVTLEPPKEGDLPPEKEARKS